MQGTCVKITSEYIVNTSIYTLLYLLLILNDVPYFHLQIPVFIQLVLPTRIQKSNINFIIRVNVLRRQPQVPFHPDMYENIPPAPPPRRSPPYFNPFTSLSHTLGIPPSLKAATRHQVTLK